MIVTVAVAVAVFLMLLALFLVGIGVVFVVVAVAAIGFLIRVVILRTACRFPAWAATSLCSPTSYGVIDVVQGDACRLLRVGVGDFVGARTVKSTIAKHDDATVLVAAFVTESAKTREELLSLAHVIEGDTEEDAIWFDVPGLGGLFELGQDDVAADGEGLAGKPRQKTRGYVVG